RTVTVTGFNGNLFNFYDPDGTEGSTFGPPVTPRTTRYYQSSGTGRLEGWESLTQYTAPGATQNDKRVHYTTENVFGGSSTAFGSNTIDAATVFAIPEPGSVALALTGGICLLRRRRNTGRSI
ncbi:MAG: PEP-CTERM sorting domain-containing protein, partial [Verrucomicrobiaceae bacterium]